MSYETVLDFWFEELTPKEHFTKDEALDQKIKERFLELHLAATRCELFSWRAYAHGRLAEIIVLDQFSRNLYRGDARSFASDPLALALAQEAIRVGANKELSLEERAFLYLPYMHSESLLIHQEALKLFKEDGLEENYQYELEHMNIIERFGRYPHRNEILGRNSTPEEALFLQGPGSSF